SKNFVVTTIALPQLSAPPEVMENPTNVYSDKSDVWEISLLQPREFGDSVKDKPKELGDKDTIERNTAKS
ncbi:hypothetical protein FCV25MIE_04054, partial [Fagus crenata]